jgi:hypothetical protein
VRRRPVWMTAAIVGGIVAVSASVGAAMPPTVAPGQLCIPIILPCAPTTPTPTATPSPSPSTPGITVPGLPGLPGSPSAPGTSPGTAPSKGGSSPTPSPSASPTPDAGAPVFTQPPAQLGAQGLSFSGLRGIQLVTVPLADGTRVPALKLSADRITIDGFSLTVRRDTGPVLATTADRMTLSGHVEVYVDSVTATTSDGHSLTLGAHTPPPDDGITPVLARVTLGLVGATADSIVYTNTDQRLKG